MPILARFESGKPARELLAELAFDIAHRLAADHARQAYRAAAYISAQRRFRLLFGLEPCLRKTDLFVPGIARAVGLEIGLQLRLVRLGDLGRSAGSHVHLGHHPLAHHGIIGIEPEPERLAIQHLLAHIAFNPLVKLGIGRRAAHHLFEGERQLRLARIVDRDHPRGRIDRHPAPCQHDIERRPEGKEMDQRLAGPAG